MNAFEAIFKQHKWLVFKNAALMTGSREEAEDILQDVFMTVWKSPQAFNPDKGKFVTWLHRITVNRCISNHRRKKPVLLPLDEATPDLPGVNSQDLPEEALNSKLEYERLIKMLSGLDSKHRPVLVLRYFNDLSYRDIADALDIPVGTVKSRLYNALCTLRGQMSLAMDNSVEEERNP
ncbi:MAG: sigma-70 family RNA polymerase sigma factor [Dehalococcoidales bacterium]|nr:sigma-70 family RNA polymerase sigma factor [Dehalococcoidales bacterium]